MTMRRWPRNFELIVKEHQPCTHAFLAEKTFQSMFHDTWTPGEQRRAEKRLAGAVLKYMDANPNGPLRYDNEREVYLYETQ